MKLTWFGGTTFRIYLGGDIVVIDAHRAPKGVDRGELLAGARRQASIAGDRTVPRIDPASWRPKPPPRAIDEVQPLEIMGIGSASLLLAASGEPPLVILGPVDFPRFGRWVDGAVIVLTSGRDSAISEASVLLDVARPRLLALAVDEQTLDVAIAELSEHLDGAGLVSLDPGLALEV